MPSRKPPSQDPFREENLAARKKKAAIVRGETPRGPMSRRPGAVNMSTQGIIARAIESVRNPTSPVGPSRAEKAAAYKAEQERRRESARKKVGPSFTRPVGPGDQATPGRGRGRRR